MGKRPPRRVLCCCSSRANRSLLILKGAKADDLTIDWGSPRPAKSMVAYAQRSKKVWVLPREWIVLPSPPSMVSPVANAQQGTRAAAIAVEISFSGCGQNQTALSTSRVAAGQGQSVSSCHRTPRLVHQHRSEARCGGVNSTLGAVPSVWCVGADGYRNPYGAGVVDRVVGALRPEAGHYRLSGYPGALAPLCEKIV